MVVITFFFCSLANKLLFISRLSIVQLSLHNRVFILDVIALAEKVSENLILAFGNAVFANENVLKLGKNNVFLFTTFVTVLRLSPHSAQGFILSAPASPFASPDSLDIRV